jgi:tRNA/tmRNA/rRNA uracil-C5-methylase (TrmA/RlmC/RlmD family)
VVLDPAREGAGKAVMAALTGTPPRCGGGLRLVRPFVVQPGHARAARCHWTLTSLRAFDIFPMTEHVELVANPRPRSTR